MGRGGGVPSGRPPSQAAYFVALAGVALLLLMLCCYFLYFCVKKIKELSEHESLCGAPARAQPAPGRTDPYPVQPVVRDSATAMAKLCKELPSGGRGTVFPAASSPAVLRADTGVGATAAADAGVGATAAADTGVGATAAANTGVGATAAADAGVGAASPASGSDVGARSDNTASTATTGASAESPPPAAAPDR